ncbi:hypothetical protein Q5752_004616 [Cryptotrichosporon argae]
MEPAPKRKRIGLKSKVFALEEQVSHVQSKLDNIVDILERRLSRDAGPAQAGPSHGAPPPRPPAMPPAPSLEQWVRNVAAAELRASEHGRDPDDSEDEAEGMTLMRQMLRAEENARLQADGHLMFPAARRRASPNDELEQRGAILSLDPIDFGLMSETDGQRLFAILRQRSPFSITTILFVAKKIEDAGGPPSDVQKVLREHAENIARTTLFSPVSTIDALQAMIPLHKVVLGQGQEDGLNRALQLFNDGLKAWDERWLDYYRRQGLQQDDILVSDHTTMRCYTCVIANSILLRTLRTPDDVLRLSKQRRQWLVSSIDSAQVVIGGILKTERIKLVAANHYSHVALASVARILIRLASLFPDAVDLRRTARDMTQLANILSELPGINFAHQLHDVIRKARRRRVFPPETRAASPAAVGAPTARPSEASSNQSPLEFDVFAADQLLNLDWPAPSHMADMPWLGLDALDGL